MLEHIWPYKEHMYASDKQPCSILSIKAANEGCNAQKGARQVELNYEYFARTMLLSIVPHVPN